VKKSILRFGEFPLRLQLTPTAITAKKATRNFMVLINDNSQSKLMISMVGKWLFILPLLLLKGGDDAGEFVNYPAIENSNSDQPTDQTDERLG